MQKIATRVFMTASIVFAVIGLLMIFTAPSGDAFDQSAYALTLQKLLMAAIVVILSSFAWSVATKYLGGGK